MAKTRTFIDSGVLIAAATGGQNLFERAFTVLDDPDREFITSDFVRLETVPKARFHKNEDEVRFYEEFFQAAAQSVDASKELVSLAQTEAETSGLNATDALHVVAACWAAADELVTSEKPQKLIFRTNSLPVKTIYPDPEGA